MKLVSAMLLVAALGGCHTMGPFKQADVDACNAEAEGRTNANWVVWECLQKRGYKF